VWPIVEQDIRTTILERLTAHLPEIKARLTESLAAYRVPATTRPTTDTARTVYVDPSITLGADLVSHDGRVLATSGQRVNPLAVLPLRRTYLVVDGEDPRQVAWARQRIEASPQQPATVLLTKGALGEARRTLPDGTPLFPAPPVLFARFPIDTVPATISRDGDRVRIDLIAEAELPAPPAHTAEAGSVRTGDANQETDRPAGRQGGDLVD
jgi:conjugal transfer pilus assembly protein TraW